jgi:hypothetical protein
MYMFKSGPFQALQATNMIITKLQTTNSKNTCLNLMYHMFMFAMYFSFYYLIMPPYRKIGSILYLACPSARLPVCKNLNI